MSGTGGDGGAFGGSGGNYDFDCSRVSTKTNIVSPDPVVVSSLRIGDLLDVQLRSATGPVIAVTNAGEVAGSLFVINLGALIACIINGHEFTAKILSINGGNVQVLISNKL